MHVELWMTADPLTIAPSATVAAAAMTMSRRRIRRLPVVEHGRLVGIVSELDVARAFPADVNPFSATVTTNRTAAPPAEVVELRNDRPVESVMTPDPITVAPHTPIDDAARIMADRRIGALPVTLGDKLVGIITESDVFRALVELVGVRENGARVTFDLSLDEEVLGTVGPIAWESGVRIASLLTLDHDGRRFAVVRVAGPRTDQFIDAVWRSGHRVASVVLPEPE